MENLNDRIIRLNNKKKLALYLTFIIFSAFLALVLWFFPKVDTMPEWVILGYFFLNLLMIFWFIFTKIRVIDPPKNSDQFEKYYIEQIDRTISHNDFAPIFVFIPAFFGLLGLWSIDYSKDLKVDYWFYIVPGIFYLTILVGWWIVRKFLREEYKKIHGVDFLSFFHF